MEGRLGKTIIRGSDHISKSDDSLDLDRTVTEMPQKISSMDIPKQKVSS